MSKSLSNEITAWMNAAGSKPVLSKEEMLIIAKKIKSHEVGSPKYKFYVNKLVSHNLRLVIRSVHLYMDGKMKKGWGGPETLDLLQTGALGLIRAAEKYDPETGYTFATYATYWIRSFVGRYAIKASSIFHIPENACRDAYSFEKYGFVKNKSHNVSEALTKLVRSAQAVISVDAPLGEDGDISIIDCLESKYPPSTEGAARFSCEMDDLIQAAGLSDDQVKVLENLFIDEMKVKDIMHANSISRVKVAALRETALEKLRRITPAA
jgi:RNA polymerase sigma factor (sigma-70 family)